MMRPGWLRPGGRCVTVVADRECKICNEFALRPANTDLLIRFHDGPARCDCNARNATVRRDDLTYVEARDIGDPPRIKLNTPGHDAGRARQIVGLYRRCWLFCDFCVRGSLGYCEFGRHRDVSPKLSKISATTNSPFPDLSAEAEIPSWISFSPVRLWTFLS